MMGDLGGYLVEGRKSKGLTREYISQVTRIPLASIIALEEERFENLPSPPYVRGFIIAYCKAAGIDERPALEAFLEIRKKIEKKDQRKIAEVSSSEITIQSRTTNQTNLAYIAILVVFIIGALVALLTIGTGGIKNDISYHDIKKTVPHSISP